MVADLVTKLQTLGNYNGILALLNSSQLLNQILKEPQITLFLPTDQALAKAPSSLLKSLQNDPQRLVETLSYHASTDEVFRLKGTLNDHVLTSLTQQPIRFNYYRSLRSSLHVAAAEGVKIVEKDIIVRNGVVQGIDGIMSPPEGNVVDILAGRSDMKTLVSLLGSANLVDAVKDDENITVFAPTDAAFKKLNPQVLSYLGSHPKALSEVLLYHVVNRLTLYSVGMRHAMIFGTADIHKDKIMLIEDGTGDIFIDHAKVSERDISGTNGVIHVIDEVLIPTRIYLAVENQGLTLVG